MGVQAYQIFILIVALSTMFTIELIRLFTGLPLLVLRQIVDSVSAFKSARG